MNKQHPYLKIARLAVDAEDERCGRRIDVGAGRKEDPDDGCGDYETRETDS